MGAPAGTAPAGYPAGKGSAGRQRAPHQIKTRCESAARHRPTSVFEAAGFPSTVLLSPKLCRVRGEIIAVAMPKEPLPVDILSITFKELTIKGIRVYALYDFEKAIQIVSNSGLDFSKLLSEPFSLTEVMTAFKMAKQGKDVMRVLLTIDEV